ncbi:hypothetical protein [Modicisalibacter sp. MOD 31.J]|uniref:hypothetical protein n=1 Tax=Modicisalibacter sp. MOD 31.J TaxID=2831897 RepID=UPI001CCB2BD7|nr:hypothetical protein [Modicisalibacter sp. MOD 31.J]MBZ9576753.1 hypothetical protein [Modicisalibacter sp. MOD 31.J]
MNTATVTPIAKARAPHLQPENLATAHLWRYVGRTPRRDYLLDGCIEDLMVNHDMPERAAENAAGLAYADLDSLNKLATIELDATTTQGLILNTGRGQRVLLTVADLLNLLQSQRLATANKETGRLLVIQR